MGTRAFSAQYQQRPIPRGGGLFKPSYFPRFNLSEEIRRGFDFVFQSWDVASSLGDDAAFSVCTTWGVRGTTDFYLIDVLRRRLEAPDVNHMADALQERYLPDIVLVEVNGIGASLYQHMRRNIGPRAKFTRVTEDKVTRAERLTAFLAMKTVHLPEAANWFETFWSELSGFPETSYSDQVDSFTQFLENRLKLIGPASRLGPLRPGGSAITLRRPRGNVRVTLFEAPPKPRWCGFV